MTYNMIKTQNFWHQTLYYSQIYNFILHHDYKFKIIIVIKGIWVSKSKTIYVIFIFWMFWTYGSLLVEYIKVHKKFEMIWQTFDKEKKLMKQKNHLSTFFLKCFKHIKGFLKHGEFSWKFCRCNFESIRIYFKN
jgi:hypothetical protein